jgi:hypothetical protein
MGAGIPLNTERAALAQILTIINEEQTAEPLWTQSRRLHWSR